MEDSATIGCSRTLCEEGVLGTKKEVGKDNREDHRSQPSFQDFREYTVQKYPNLAFLGPTCMAVYWFRTYLKEDWIRCNVVTEKVGKQHRAKKQEKKHYRPKKGGSFLHIPKKYLESNNSITIQDILRIGIVGKHYADSYMGLYNMIRQYGTFSRDDNGATHLTGYNCPELPLWKS